MHDRTNETGAHVGRLYQEYRRPILAYLTRLTGASFLEYLEQGQAWGEGGMQATLSRQLEQSARSEWLMQFAKMAIQRLFRH